MVSTNIGNTLYQLTLGARLALFDQGELAQLTYGAFDVVATNLKQSNDESIDVSFPVGYKADKTTIQSTRNYPKDELLARYQFLASHQLSKNGVVQIVTIIEALLGDIIRTIIGRYPQKLGQKRTISLQSVLEAKSIDEIHLSATDSLLNELSYKSPKEFADSLNSCLSINLFECPAFHKYIEVKATRDVYIHNRGITNEIYTRKADSHARATVGTHLPVDIPYFLESYEACLQLTEWLEKGLHERWHSSDLEELNQSSIPTNSPPVMPAESTNPAPKKTTQKRKSK